MTTAQTDKGMSIQEFIQQRVAQAWDVAHSPDLMVCIQPAEALSGDKAERILNLLRNAMAKSNQSLVVLTSEAIMVGFSKRAPKSAAPEKEVAETADQEEAVEVTSE